MDTTTLLYIGLAVIVVGVDHHVIADLLEIVGAFDVARLIARFVQRRKQHRRENRYNRYHGELEHIAKYFQATKKEEFTIDDITWNDLDMDSVFCMMNQCRSSSGDDYLYKLLRTPLTSKKELEERNRIISFFQRNEKNSLPDGAFKGRSFKEVCVD